VLNHKAGADESEVFKAVKVDPNNRTREIEEARDIEGWTKFTFPGRQGKYSDFVWSFQHFNGVDYDARTGENGIFKIIWEQRDWNQSVSGEKGNYDYLMFADIDHFNPDVRGELFSWIEWFINETNIDGVRYDALKHIDDNFIRDLTNHILANIRNDFYFVGEYWENNLDNLTHYIDQTSNNVDLFDVTLHYKFHEASKSGGYFDLRSLFDNTLESQKNLNTVTFVDNHDSQLGQSLESWVDNWFREIAYSIILLGKDGYPCVFFGDLFGIGDGSMYGGMRDKLNLLMELRRDYAYGEEKLFLQEANA
ncbi:alpha-amylase, partial [Rhodovulum adriaticum]|nr:alpha-amylase [Rhodovulum adriaticum]